MYYVDSHCHLNLKKFSKVAEASSSGDYSIDAIVERAKNAGVEYILNIGTELSDIEEMQSISMSYDNVFHTIGIHPLEAQKHHQQYSLDEISRIIKANCNDEKCVGIGEIGLDYYYTKESAKEQKELFELQLANVTLDPVTASLPSETYARCTCNNIFVRHPEERSDVGIQNNIDSTHASKSALAYNEDGGEAINASQARTAVCVHSREAEEDTIAILRNHPGVTGVIHCFSGSKEFAFQALDLGFYISISGVVTFKSNVALQEIVKSIPLDRLLVETDAPFLAPTPFRGKVNEPAFMVHTAKKIAELLGVTADEISSQTSENFFNLYPRAKKFRRYIVQNPVF
ncbi:hypothetical protein FACS189472_01940 [Alphaproteobacteria bacterium]|nr:hypothetical protein FACS189472_01940 [Alphaproteobacteria bacterium]